MKFFPNLFTLLNLIFGCIAIVFVLQNGIIVFTSNEGTQLLDIPEKIWMASLFIGLAALADFFDGLIARLFNATSELGKQLDSLSDIVSFGVAPALIIYQFLRLSYAQQEDGLDIFSVWLFIAFLIPAAAAYRLAKFNLDDSQQYSFKGVPVPAVGLLIASLPLIYWNVNEAWVIKLLLNKWFLYGLIFLLSYLMISNWSMMSLKFKGLGLKNNLPKYVFLVLAVLAIVILKWLAIPVIFIIYVLVSLLFKNKIA